MRWLAFLFAIALIPQTGAAQVAMMPPAEAAQALQAEPDSQPQPEAVPQRTTVKLRFVGKEARTPVTYELVKGLMLFKANIAGREVWTLLDNGAGRSIIDLSLARDAGLDVTTQRGTLKTPTGELPKLGVDAVPFIIPGQIEMQTPLLAVDLAALSNLNGRKIEAILGGDFLRSLALVVNSGRQTFQLYPSGAVKPPAAYPMVTLRNSQVELTVGSETLRATIDLGMSSDLSLTPGAWERVKPANSKFISRIVSSAEGKPHIQDFANLPEIMIGQVTQKSLVVGVRDWPADKGDGMVGMGLMKRFDFVLDIKAGKLWLIPRIPSS